jgi:hypothetical protein
VAVEEVHHVAGLVAGVRFPAPVAHRSRRVPGREGRRASASSSAAGPAGRVGQDGHGEAVRVARRRQVAQQVFQRGTTASMSSSRTQMSIPARDDTGGAGPPPFRRIPGTTAA